MVSSIKLVLIRHGETEANRDRIMQGHCDYPLTKKGCEEAQCVGKSLRDVQWRCIFSSDLPRTVKTTSFILEQRNTDVDGRIDLDLEINSKPIPIDEIEKAMNMKINQTNLAREVYKGIREGLPKDLNIHEVIEIISKKTGQPIESIKDNSESYAQVFERQHLLLQEIIKECEASATETGNGTVTDNHMITENGSGDVDYGNVLCVSHGGFIKLFLMEQCRLSLPTIPTIKNCSITTIDVKWEYEDKDEDEDNNLQIEGEKLGAGAGAGEREGEITENMKRKIRIVCNVEIDKMNCVHHADTDTDIDVKFNDEGKKCFYEYEYLL
jgi:broad specificity phosphatase PhoE